jgi:hypothetical protein
MDALLSEVLAAHGGLEGWSRLTRITAQLSIGGPIWAAKGWPGANASGFKAERLSVGSAPGCTA